MALLLKLLRFRLGFNRKISYYKQLDLHIGYEGYSWGPYHSTVPILTLKQMIYNWQYSKTICTIGVWSASEIIEFNDKWRVCSIKSEMKLFTPQVNLVAGCVTDKESSTRTFTVNMRNIHRSWTILKRISNCQRQVRT